jgi:predicted extracellular nuclease
MNKSLFKMFSSITILALVLMALPVQSALAATTIAQWTFESPNTPADAPNVATYPNSISPAVGAGNAGGVHATAGTDWTTPVGNGSADSFSSNEWLVGDYYQFTVSTSNYTDILVSWDQASSGTGPRDFKLAYSTDGTNFTDFGSPYTVLANASPNPVWNATTSSALYSTSRDLSAVTAVDNQANVYFRLIDISTVSASGGVVGTGGTNRVDNFTVSGDPIVVVDTAPSVTTTSPANGATNVAVNTNITVNFSEAVDVAAGAITVECPSGTPVASNVVADNVTSVVIDPASDLPVSTACVANVDDAGVTDEDTDDPPDDMDADFNWGFTTLTPIVSSVIINEIDADNVSVDALEFVELYDGGAGNTDLSGLVVVFYNGSVDTSYAAFDLDGFSTNAAGYFLLGNSAVSPAPSIIFSNDTLQNGADAVALFGANASDFPNGTAVTTTNLVDAVVYDTADADDAGLLVLLNAGQPQVDENGGGNGTAHSSQRCPNGSGGARNTSSYAQFNPTAGTSNFCVNDAAPSVTGTNPTGGASNVSNSATIDVTFSESVNVAGSWYDISCTNSGVHTALVSGGPTTFTLDPDTDFVNSDTCTVTVVAAQVADQDTNDPPDNMLADHVFSFSTEGPICDQDFTPIYDIQGSGSATTIPGNVTTEGVVVGDFEGTASASGFYIQDLTGDSNAATSDGIFVFTGSTDLASAGDIVRVTGFARERFNQTTLNGSNSNTAPVTNVVNCGSGSVTATDVALPFTSATFPERYEGMLVRFPQPLVIAEYFNYDRFGELVLALPLGTESRPFTGTAIDEPGAPANARTAANALSRITLDDAQSAQNPPALRHPNGATFTLANKFRGGDTVQNAVGVLGFDFSLYRIFPTGPADYTSVNPRTASPEPVGGTLRVAAMNTLNFFVTLDTTASDTGGGPCGANQNLDCRGADADQPDEFTRQRDKLLTALLGLDADVIGLNELESTPGAEPMISIVTGMPGYDYIDTGPIGTDAIKVGLIYRPAVVTPIGDFELLTTAVDPRFIDTKSRPSLAQTFEVNATGARFTVVVNHLKSKGSACDDVGDPDLGDGQGNCSQTRRAAAEALVDWLATDPTGSGDPDFLIMGDLNSYAMEDAIDEIKAGSDDIVSTTDDYTNLISHFHGAFAYSYTFDGQAGYLDHALANASMFSQVTGAADWHINSDEPDILDYDTSFKPPAQEALYEVDPYRTSDHDPVIVGLDLPEVIPPTVTIDEAAGQDDPTGVSPINFTAVFSEPVVGFDSSDVTLGGTAGATTALVTEVAPNDGTTYNIAVSGMTANGTVTASIPANAATDAAGNNSIASTSTDNTVTFNNTAPTIVVAAGGVCGSSGGTMNLTVSDAEGDSLTISGSSSNTSAVPNANIAFGGSGSNRTVTITAVPASTVRTAVVTITVDDGISTASTTITVIVGTSGNNMTLNGTSDADLILGLDGNDTLNGLGGNDLLCGGAKNDTLNGGDNDDTLDGQTSNDVLNGNNGNDILRGDIGNDTLTGGAAADAFSGGPGSDSNTDFNAGQGDTSDGT